MNYLLIIYELFTNYLLILCFYYFVVKKGHFVPPDAYVCGCL